MDSINDLEDRLALEVQIGEFGQVPKQLFSSAHPAKIMPKTSSEDVEDSSGLIPKSVHRLSNADVVKYWQYDISALQMVCDYQLHKCQVKFSPSPPTSRSTTPTPSPCRLLTPRPPVSGAATPRPRGWKGRWLD